MRKSTLKQFLNDNLVVVLFCVAGLLVMAIAAYTSFFVYSLSSYFSDSVEYRMRFVSSSATRLVTAEELEELRVPEDMEKPLFLEVRSRLIAFGREANVLFVYFLRSDGEGMVQFIVDNDTGEDAVNLASEPIPMESAVAEAFTGRTMVTGLGNYSQGYEGLLSSFSPVLDKDGNIVALAGVDITDEQILDTRNRIIGLSIIILGSTAIVVFCGVLSASINRKRQTAFVMRLRQQELMSGLARSFIAAADTSTLITGALRMTGEFLEVDRMLIGIAEMDSPVSRAAYVWSRSETVFTSPQTEGLNDLITNTFPRERPEHIPTICCNDVHEDPRYRALDTVGVNAFIWAPLYVEGVYWAVLSIEEFKRRVWTESDRQLVSTVSSVIAGAVERGLREKERDAARQAAEQASKAKSDFLANMSHEMRTPMNAIIGMTAIAKNSHELEKKEYCLNKIENASTHLLGVINDILDMSKIEANKFELSPIEFNFEKTLQKVVNVITFRVDEKRQNLSVHIDRNIPKILYGDDQRLSQVIANLLSNAVKFTPDGGSVRLDTRLEKKDGDVCVLRISVTDSGIGISAEQQNRLFSSFQQADTSTSRKFGGTGLGLAISKRIVEMMGGSFEIISELGKGASFIFTAQLQEAAGELEELPPVNWEHIRVLAVDDDPDIREYFGDIAGRLGFGCDTAADGAEALQKIERGGAYDLYFVDWKMPGIDGIELSRRIRESGGGGRSVVIMMSAVDWNTVETDAKDAGVHSFLPKPLFPSGIADCISRSLGTAEQVSAARTEEDLTGHFEGKRILLAEDVDINREIVLALLEPTGLAIDCAENGKQAAELFTRSPGSYDLIFMDVQMPEMDGYEATRTIRASGASGAESVPIIAMTANVFREDIEQCLEAGMNGHVGKPLDLNEVMGVLRRYL